MTWGPRIGDHGDSEGDGTGDKGIPPFPAPRSSVRPQDGVWVSENEVPRGVLTACTGRRSQQSASCAGGTPGPRSPDGRVDAISRHGPPALPTPPAQTRPVIPAGTWRLHPAKPQGSTRSQRQTDTPSQAGVHAHRPSHEYGGRSGPRLTGWSKSRSGSNLVTRW